MNNCQISDNWKYNDMQVVFMENEFLRVGILTDRGSDIFEFRYKPLNVDPILRLNKDIVNPSKTFSQLRNTPNQMQDYYYGGWQECLPNSPTFNYRGASLGQHGEVSLIPWKYSIIKDDPHEVILRLSTRPLRMPVYIEKELSLRKNESVLYITETLKNESRTSLDIMWGHHIAFGLPFLADGAAIKTNARSFAAEPSMPEPRRFVPGKTFTWPNGNNQDGNGVDASIIQAAGTDPYSDLSYLKGFDKNAFYTLRSNKYPMEFRLDWDGELFQNLWMWEERYATQDFPWWGECFALALEPWTSPWTDDPKKAMEENHWLQIKPGQIIETKLQASLIPDDTL